MKYDITFRVNVPTEGGIVEAFDYVCDLVEDFEEAKREVKSFVADNIPNAVINQIQISLKEVRVI